MDKAQDCPAGSCQIERFYAPGGDAWDDVLDSPHIPATATHTREPDGLTKIGRLMLAWADCWAWNLETPPKRWEPPECSDCLEPYVYPHLYDSWFTLPQP